MLLTLSDPPTKVLNVSKDCLFMNPSTQSLYWRLHIWPKAFEFYSFLIVPCATYIAEKYWRHMKDGKQITQGIVQHILQLPPSIPVQYRKHKMWLLGCIGQTWILLESPQPLFQIQPFPILLWDLCKDLNNHQFFFVILISWKVLRPFHLWFCQYKCYPNWCQMELCSPMSSKIAKKIKAIVIEKKKRLESF